MIRARTDFFSESLGLCTSMTVLFPQQADGQIGQPERTAVGETPMLYLLHGLSDDDTIWTRRTNIERYAAELGLAVVMPQVHRSFYCDQVAGGGDYWQFISSELPALVQATFHLSNARESTFVAGLSMGGYGAFKLALRQPGRFAAAASLSGLLDLAGRADAGFVQDEWQDRPRVFGDRVVTGGEDDLFALLASADPATLPQLYLSCGTEDALLPDSRRFAALARRRGIELTTHFPPGDHEWALWDDQIRRVLAWLPLANATGS